MSEHRSEHMREYMSSEKRADPWLIPWNGTLANQAAQQPIMNVPSLVVMKSALLRSPILWVMDSLRCML
jgi:hypothetical protein